MCNVLMVLEVVLVVLEVVLQLLLLQLRVLLKLPSPPRGGGTFFPSTVELIQRLHNSEDDRPSNRPSDRTYPYQASTHIPHPLCRESYHLGSHFGTIWG